MPRKMIYVPSEEVWEGIRKSAKEKGKSVSSYLMDSGNSQMDRIESKLDLLIRSSSVFIEESGVIPNDVYEKIEPRKGASEILDSMKPANPVKPDKVILEELCEKVEESEKSVENVSPRKDAIVRKQINKVTSTKAGWVNPLLNSKLAPKKG